MNVKYDLETINEAYIQWLYAKVGGTDRKYNHFWRVIRRLYLKEFYSLVPNDDNRLQDGLALRGEFIEEYQYDPNIVAHGFDFPCTVLEMLVAFARRIDFDIMWDPEIGDRSAFWFWKMLENAGVDLKRFSDEYFNEECILELNKIVDRVLTRRYDRNGNGSFFPISAKTRNYQRYELWHQMQLWISENYPIC